MESLRQPQSVLVIGIGTELRGDDAAGLLAVRQLGARGAPDCVRFLESSDGGVNLMEAWRGFDSVILIDAVSAGLPPGTIISADVKVQPTPWPLQSSTHHIGLAETIELARVLDALPPLLFLYGVQGRSFQPGEGLSPEVSAAIDRVVTTVNADLHQWCFTKQRGMNRADLETSPSFLVSSNEGSR